jgi:hypothetical protein
MKLDNGQHRPVILRPALHKAGLDHAVGVSGSLTV